MLLEIGSVLFITLVVGKILEAGRRKIQTPDGRIVTARPFSAIPGPGRVTLMLEAARGGVIGQLHNWMTDRATRYGPIMKEHIFGTDMVLVSGVALIEELAKQESKFPMNFQLEHVQDYHQRHGRPLGVTSSKGEEWKKLRSPWNHTMLKTSKVYEAIPRLNEVNTDFIQRLQERKDDRGIVSDVDKEIFRWALESVGVLLYEARLGCLDEGKEEADEFIKAVIDLFTAFEVLSNMSVEEAKIQAPEDVQKHEHALDVIYHTAKILVDQKAEEVARDTEEGVEPSGFLGSVLASEQLTKEEVYSSVSEIMLPAIDTTTATVQFMLYELSRNPEVQQKVYDEICETTGGAQPTADHLRKMEYVKATVREVQRLYPAGIGASRVIQEDTVIGGYHLPPGTSLLTDGFYNGRNASNFDDPLTLRPERWIKAAGRKEISPYSSIIFGFGSRGCIGRKTAETQMQILLTRILQKFELRYGAEEPIKMFTRATLTPDRPVPVCFIDRL